METFFFFFGVLLMFLLILNIQKSSQLHITKRIRDRTTQNCSSTTHFSACTPKKKKIYFQEFVICFNKKSENITKRGEFFELFGVSISSDREPEKQKRTKCRTNITKHAWNSVCFSLWTSHSTKPKSMENKCWKWVPKSFRTPLTSSVHNLWVYLYFSYEQNREYKSRAS